MILVNKLFSLYYVNTLKSKEFQKIFPPVLDMESKISLFQKLAGIDALDFLNIHIYPIQRDYFAPKVSEIAGLTNKQKKALIVGEAW